MEGIETLKTDEKLLEERKQKVAEFLKIRYSWISYLALVVIVFIAVRIRTNNLDGLRDITTGGWTLGPDLDPFLFLRLARYIVEHGSLMAVDFMRNVPLGFVSKNELILLPYLIAWFHKIAVFFGSASVEQSAALFPVFMFALTVIAFFLLARKLFVDSLGELRANIIALGSAFFLAVIPAILPRTIAGIPEKESAGFLFMFLAFYFFLRSWKAEKNTGRIFNGLLAGASTAAMALVWGGFVYIFLTIEIAVILAFLLGQVTKEKVYGYAAWMFSAFALMIPFSTRYSVINLFVSTTTGLAIFVFFILILDLIIFNTRIKKYFERFSKVPRTVIAIIVAVLIAVVAVSVLFGPGFISDKFTGAIDQLIHPFATDRFSVTVAENRMPYFNEWAGSFGRFFGNIPIFFWLFFIGSIYLFAYMTKVFENKERIILTISYAAFLTALIFSRYSPNSILNGDNFISNLVYFGGMLVLILSFAFCYYKYYKENKLEGLKKLDFGLIMIFALFFFSIVSARGGVRLIMMLVPPTSIIVSYFVVSAYGDYKKVKDELFKVIAMMLVGIFIIAALFSAYQFYNVSSSEAGGYVPSVYTQQWQKAMAWVRENTQENAVFGHWWDYGYWLQSIGNRATVLDGGNAIVYWNHMMGRYALTGADDFKAIDYLYSHNTTHFLIDSTDIGKYSAFSSIGSDEKYDRYSWIDSLVRDESQTRENKNSTAYIYSGGILVDGDIMYAMNGTNIFLPGGKAVLGGVILMRDEQGVLQQPSGAFFYQNNQYSIPLRYAYDNKLIDFGSGLDAGIFLMSALNGNSGIIDDGALIYLSPKTVKSQVARLYLYGENNQYFKTVHVEDDYVVSQIKNQVPSFKEDFLFYNGVRGPIKIWEIKYPDGMQVKEEYLLMEYPDLKFRFS